jgi:hypothetical protein
MQTQHPEITLRLFRPEDQTAVKNLILAGLKEHWGTLDPTLNPDLNDIAQTYANATFLVAWEGDRIIGTGALVPREITQRKSSGCPWQRISAAKGSAGRFSKDYMSKPNAVGVSESCSKPPKPGWK